MSDVEKTRKIMDYASKLESKAKRKEELDKVNKNAVDEELD